MNRPTANQPRDVRFGNSPDFVRDTLLGLDFHFWCRHECDHQNHAVNLEQKSKHAYTATVFQNKAFRYKSRKLSAKSTYLFLKTAILHPMRQHHAILFSSTTASINIKAEKTISHSRFAFLFAFFSSCCSTIDSPGRLEINLISLEEKPTSTWKGNNEPDTSK